MLVQVVPADLSVGQASSPDRPQRRVSNRTRVPRATHSPEASISNPVPAPRRNVRDRWHYVPVGLASVEVLGLTVIGSSSEEVPDSEEEPITQAQVTQLVKRFNVEGRNRRSALKARVRRTTGMDGQN
jgi:hypothetical protein